MDSAEREWALSQVGRVLGSRWTLERLLATGGTAHVFEASHRNGKRVAVKVLRPERATSPSTRRRFLSEGYAANRVGHPAVVGVDDDGEEADGTAYLVMELLEGESLDRKAERLGGRLPWRLTLEIALELLDVLESAHARGIVHRDIKPANLWWSVDDKLRVLDFGLARFAEAPPTDHLSTADGAVLGTPAFMAPEQARAAAVGPLSDIWAVGATAFALLTGRRVYEAPTPEEQLALAAVSPAPSLRVHAPELPAAVADVFQRALAHDARERWPRAQVMRAALAEAAEGRAPISPRAASATHDDTLTSTLAGASTAGEKRRRVGTLILPGLGIGAVLALAGVVLWQERSSAVRAHPAAPVMGGPVRDAESAPSSLPGALTAAAVAGASSAPPREAAPRASARRPAVEKAPSAPVPSHSARAGEAPLREMIEEPPF
ncbi:MAG TPA: serine/threonine-protein kinase [Polyangiaceae bacterium]